jgi:Tol biopolymer transport system component
MMQRATAVVLSLFFVASCSGTDDYELQVLREKVEAYEATIESTTTVVIGTSTSALGTTTPPVSTTTEAEEYLTVVSGGETFNILFDYLGGAVPGSDGFDFPDQNTFVMDSDGANVRLLIDNDFTVEFNPFETVWSPDGTKIAFNSKRDGARNIYAIDLDRSSVQQLTDTTGSNSDPDWSPDGTKIAFDGWRDDDNSYVANIYVMDQDGSSVQQLTANRGLNFSPDWSPDGTKIAFSSNRDGFHNIYVMNQDGSSVQQLTANDNCGSRDPQWSPDGKRIVYSVGNATGERSCSIPTGIALILIDGSGFQQLSAGFLPRWSPDGTQIIFSSSRWGETEIFSFDLTSSAVVSLGVEGFVSDTR